MVIPFLEFFGSGSMTEPPRGLKKKRPNDRAHPLVTVKRRCSQPAKKRGATLITEPTRRPIKRPQEPSPLVGDETGGFSDIQSDTQNTKSHVANLMVIFTLAKVTRVGERSTADRFETAEAAAKGDGNGKWDSTPERGPGLDLGLQGVDILRRPLGPPLQHLAPRRARGDGTGLVRKARVITAV